MRLLTPKWFFEMAGIPSAAFVFDGDLATELETYAKANVELLSRVANIALAIISPNLACYTGRSCTPTSRSTCAKLTSLGWRFNTEIGSAHLPGCHLPGKLSVECP